MAHHRRFAAAALGSLPLQAQARRLLVKGGCVLSLDPNIFTITGQLLPDKKMADVEKALEEEIRRIGAEPITDRELEKAKNQIEASFVFGQDSNFYQAMLLARFELVGSWRDIDEYMPAIRKVTAEDVQRVARQYLQADQRTVGILQPTGPAKRNVDAAKPRPRSSSASTSASSRRSRPDWKYLSSSKTP